MTVFFEDYSAVSVPWALDLCYNRAAVRRTGRRSVAVEMRARKFYVSGRVQGVGFRFFAEQIAASLGVGGYVRNLYDGRVEVYAIGRAEQMEKLKHALQRGPRMAAVDVVEEHDAEILQNYSGTFSIEQDE
jgi:acylphosphatase